MLLVISCCSVMERAENVGRWSCALAHYNGTPEYISSDYECCFASDYESAANISSDYGSAARKSRRIKFSSCRALERDRRANRCVLRIM